MQTKLEALAGVGAFSKAARALIMRTDDGIKIAGLADKARDASVFLYQPENDPDEKILQALAIECAERNLGETPEELAEKIVGKADRARQIRAKLDGLEDRMKTAISMAPTDELAVQTFHGARELAFTELEALGIPRAMLGG